MFDQIDQQLGIAGTSPSLLITILSIALGLTYWPSLKPWVSRVLSIIGFSRSEALIGKIDTAAGIWSNHWNKLNLTAEQRKHALLEQLIDLTEAEGNHAAVELLRQAGTEFYNFDGRTPAQKANGKKR